jgi:hypothetical protein
MGLISTAPGVHCLFTVKPHLGRVVRLLLAVEDAQQVLHVEVLVDVIAALRGLLLEPIL